MNNLILYKHHYTNNQLKSSYHRDENGKLQGLYTGYYPSGKIEFVGRFKHDKQKGLWYYSNIGYMYFL